MGYEKEFFEENGVEKVKITATEDSRGFWDSEKQDWVKKEKTFEVVEKVVEKEKVYEIYERIENGEPINLKDKYIQGFSLGEYREKNGLSEDTIVELKDFNAEKAFFDSSFSFLDTSLEGSTSFKHAIFNGDVSFTENQSFVNNIIVHNYKKEFNEDRTKVKITATGDSKGFWNSEKRKFVKEKTFEVVEKRGIYESIENEEPINLKGKYVQEFSLGEYRKEHDMGEYDEIELIYFSAKGTFFDGGANFFCAFFEGDAIFTGVAFGEGKVSFWGARFGDGEVSSRHQISLLLYQIDHRGTNFGDDAVRFGGANFGKGDVSFERTRFGDRDVFFRDVTFGDGNIDFQKATFGEGEVSFKGASFGEGHVSFVDACFGEGNVSFWGANFADGNAYFSKANFGDGNINFGGASFGERCVFFEDVSFGDGNVYFGGTNFGEEDVLFKRVTFGEGNISFRGATFGNGNVSFEGASFGEGDVYFDDASFGEGNVSFEDVSFEEGGVWFDRADFGDGNIDFQKATFGEGEVSFEGASFGEGDIIFQSLRLGIRVDWDMRVRGADTIDFTESKIYGNIDFGFYEDDEGNGRTPQVNELRFINTKLYGTIHMDYDEFNMPNAINDQDTSHREKQDQFRLLKENFRNLGQYDDEDKAYRWFMKHKIRHKGGFDDFIPATIKGLNEVTEKLYHNPFKDTTFKKKCKYFARNLAEYKGSIIGFMSFPFKWLVFEKMGLYGTSPARVALSMAIVVALFSLIYSPLTEPGATMHSPLFHSVITFLTIGYGDNYISMNSFWSQFFSGIEGFMGLFLMSYFTISFVRKVLR